jgi:hypothetical protein
MPNADCYRLANDYVFSTKRLTNKPDHDPPFGLAGKAAAEYGETELRIHRKTLRNLFFA